MLRLKRLTIRKFRNLPEDTELHFADGLNVLIGKNGTGKTTLLDLITMILGSDFSSIEGEDFDFGYLLESGNLVLELDTWAKSETRFSGGLEASALAGAAPGLSRRTTWEYRGVLRGEEGEFHLRVSSEGVHTPPLSPDADETKLSMFEPSFLLWLALSSVLPESLIDALFSLHTRAGRFDEGLEVFRGITGGSHLGGPNTAGPVRVVYPNGQGFAARLDLTPDQVSGALVREVSADTWRPTTDSLPFLARVRDVLHVADIRLRPVVAERRRGATFEYWTIDRFELDVELDPTTTVLHDRLSFGQKRLFAFWWYLAANEKGPVIADELVNGLHYAWVEACVDEIGERQAFLSSQNPILLDFLEFSKPEDVQRAFVLCSLEDDPASPGSRRWAWRQPTAEQAQEFFRAYEVGIQHVSEILRTRGLW